MRRLASILFADIAGYTAMMQADEEKARQVLKKFNDSINTKVPEFSGEVIQFYGDGCLVLFTSSVEAMTCCVALQKEFLGSPNVPVRMGVHSGDVFFEANNAFGNSINETSRIESLGIPNSILFSERIKNDIKNHAQFKFVSLGDFEFKSLDRPMEVFAISGNGLAVPEKGKIDGKLKKTPKEKSRTVLFWLIPLLALSGLIAWWNGAFSARNSESGTSKYTKIAVLPFEVNGDEDLAYLGEGLMDIMSNKINAIEGMVAVDPKISTAIFERSGRQYAEALGMPDWEEQQTNYLVTGNLVQLGESFTLLGSIKDKDGREIANVEEAVTNRDSLFPKVNSFFKKIVSQVFQNKEIDFNSYALQSTQNYDALNDFLKAEQARRKGSYELAHNFYRAATEKDSAFALAWFRWSININFFNPNRDSPKNERHIKNMMNKHKDGLPPIYRNYLVAWNLATSGKVLQAIGKAKENLETFGDHIDGLYLYGDLMYHCNFLANRSSRESIPIFKTIMQYDNSYLEAERHLLIMAIMDEDSVLLKEMSEKYPGEDPHRGVLWLGRRILNNDLATYLQDSLSQYQTRRNVVYDMLTSNDADIFIHTYRDQKDTMQQAIQVANNNRISTLELQGQMDQAFSERPDYYLNYYFTYAAFLLEKTFQPFRQNIIDSILASLPTSKKFTEESAWHVATRGTYYAQGGYEGKTQETLRKLDSFYTTSETDIARSQINFLRHRLKLIQARIAGNNRAVEAQLDSLYNNSIHYESYINLGVFFGGIKHLEAEYLLEKGEYDEAKRIFELLPENLIYRVPFLHAVYAFKMAFINEQLGNTEDAYSDYKYFLSIYEHCDDYYKDNVNHARLFVNLYESENRRD